MASIIVYFHDFLWSRFWYLVNPSGTKVVNCGSSQPSIKNAYVDKHVIEAALLTDKVVSYLCLLYKSLPIFFIFKWLSSANI